jgi:hypothetical protein
MGWLGGNAGVLGREFARRATPEKCHANGDAEKTVGWVTPSRTRFAGGDSDEILPQPN